MTYYDMLGISETATQEQIKNAYREDVKQWHPDKHSGSKEAETRFKEIVEAYSVLSDPQLRTEYDNSLLQESQNQQRGEYFNELFQYVLNAMIQGYSKDAILQSLRNMEERADEDIADYIIQAAERYIIQMAENLKGLTESSRALTFSSAGKAMYIKLTPICFF